MGDLDDLRWHGSLTLQCGGIHGETAALCVVDPDFQGASLPWKHDVVNVAAGPSVSYPLDSGNFLEGTAQAIWHRVSGRDGYGVRGEFRVTHYAPGLKPDADLESMPFLRFFTGGQTLFSGERQTGIDGGVDVGWQWDTRRDAIRTALRVTVFSAGLPDSPGRPALLGFAFDWGPRTDLRRARSEEPHLARPFQNVGERVDGDVKRAQFRTGRPIVLAPGVPAEIQIPAVLRESGDLTCKGCDLKFDDDPVPHPPWLTADPIQMMLRGTPPAEGRFQAKVIITGGVKDQSSEAIVDIVVCSGGGTLPVLEPKDVTGRSEVRVSVTGTQLSIEGPADALRGTSIYGTGRGGGSWSLPPLSVRETESPDGSTRSIVVTMDCGFVGAAIDVADGTGTSIKTFTLERKP